MVSMGYYDQTLDLSANSDFVFRIIMIKPSIIVYNVYWITTDKWLDPVERVLIYRGMTCICNVVF